jgi:hypothetical protein
LMAMRARCIDLCIHTYVGVLCNTDLAAPALIQGLRSLPAVCYAQLQGSEPMAERP